MIHSFRSAAHAAVCALACAPVFAASAPASPDPAAIPVEAFFESPLLFEPRLSPSGDAVAALMRVNGRRQLVILDSATLRKAQVIARFDATDVGFVEWVNDRRLVFSQGFEDGTVRLNSAEGLWAVDRDGTGQKQLVRADWNVNSETGSNVHDRTLTADFHFVTALRDDSDDVILERDVLAPMSGSANRFHEEILYATARRLDTRTGETHSVVADKVPEHARQWVYDDHGAARGAFTRHEGAAALLAPKGSDWDAIARFAAYDVATDGIRDAFAGVDGNLYVVRGAVGAGHTTGLFRFDPKRWQMDAAPLITVKGFDFAGELVEDHCTHKVLGLHYDSDAWGAAWFDPAMKAMQASIDAQLPGRSNLVDPASCVNAAPVLVTSRSDHTPAQYFLYTAADNSLRAISPSRPGIDPRQMADTDFYRIKARDGTEFPVYVTKPHGKGPWPTVVLVHGGPNVRGWSWEWDDESQFLASRGYLVVKPEFRGSAGYGSDLESAGYRQWGLAMQDDIADATTWAAAQGWSDSKRTCIMGGSYGGYAALMGLARYPTLYRCGVASAAVADIDMMFDTWWSDQPDDWKNFGMPLTVGDRKKDSAQFAATSPLKLAARIRQPLLLEHGALDRRVPIEQAQTLRGALEGSHAPLTWVYYPEEGHGLYIQKDRFDFYRQVERFLGANIGAAAAATASN